MAGPCKPGACRGLSYLECTECPEGSTFISTRIQPKTGWCNTYQKQVGYGKKKCGTGLKPPDAQPQQCHGCQSCGPNHRSGFGKCTVEGNTQCTSCREGQNMQPTDQFVTKLADGTVISQAAMFGVGVCRPDGQWPISKWKGGSRGLSMYHPCAPWCTPKDIWNPDKIVCTKICVVQFRLEAPGQPLYLVE